MSDLRNRILNSLTTRFDDAAFAYNFNDKVFKVASWFLTLGAVKLAAEITHSRALSFVVVILTGLFWLPAGYFVVGPDLGAMPSRKMIITLIFKVMALASLGVWVNGRIDMVVNAIVAQHFVK